MSFGEFRRPSWISKRNNFRNFESLCHCDASHQVSAQSDFGLTGDILSRISRWPPRRPSWTSERNDFSNFESLCHCDSSHQVSAQSDLRFGGRCRFKNLKMAARPGHLGYRNRTIVASLDPCVTVLTLIKFLLNRT